MLRITQHRMQIESEGGGGEQGQTFVLIWMISV